MTGGRFRRERRAVAAMEFGLIAPGLLAFVAGLTDFGLALWYQSQMASAVAQGAQFAYLNPTTGPNPIINVVEAAAPFLKAPLTTTTVTVSGPGNPTSPAPAFACVNTANPPVPTPEASATITCADGTNAGLYVTITAKYLYPAILPFYSQLGNTTLSESITVRIQ